MNAATAETVYNTARMMLNDAGIPIQYWTDLVLAPMMYDAHLELQIRLKQRAAPIMKGWLDTIIPAGTFSTIIADMT